MASACCSACGSSWPRTVRFRSPRMASPPPLAGRNMDAHIIYAPEAIFPARSSAENPPYLAHIRAALHRPGATHIHQPKVDKVDNIDDIAYTRARRLPESKVDKVDNSRSCGSRVPGRSASRSPYVCV